MDTGTYKLHLRTSKKLPFGHQTVYMNLKNGFWIVQCTRNLSTHNVSLPINLYWKYALAYLNDRIIFSKDHDKHLKYIKDILTEILSYIYNINLEKSEFCKTDINYLNYRIQKGMIRISEEKTKA